MGIQDREKKSKEETSYGVRVTAESSTLSQTQVKTEKQSR